MIFLAQSLGCQIVLYSFVPTDKQNVFKQAILLFYMNSKIYYMINPSAQIENSFSKLIQICQVKGASYNF